MSNRYVDMYKHLDETDPLKVALSTTDVARQYVELNYGTHRLLSALVHELRARRHKEIQERFARGDTIYQDQQQSPLADGIEQLLNKGYYY